MGVYVWQHSADIPTSDFDVVYPLPSIPERSETICQAFLESLNRFRSEFGIQAKKLKKQLELYSESTIIFLPPDFTLRHIGFYHHILFMGGEDGEWETPPSHMRVKGAGSSLRNENGFVLRSKAGLVRRTLVRLIVCVMEQFMKTISDWFDIVGILSDSDPEQLRFGGPVALAIAMDCERVLLFLGFLLPLRSESTEERIWRHLQAEE
ncbi:hypothetical protein BJ508DRAFT_34980 [Ascobolus immersus RN42]|uniref:Uncharacterized protein n=1 Tax=Ascobolus immersus RN42 TaxID=1160509 RepID=A0A3N4HPP0_ASCIM|nr:hypothetical protein BJ508DRAFT_34980 [Ascobolus immersus RN42]